MTTEKRKKEALGEFNEYISGYHRFTRDTVETIRELLQPTPQNREADIQEALLTRVIKVINKAQKELLSINDDTRHDWIIRELGDAYNIVDRLRADLANRPALDAELVEEKEDTLRELNYAIQGYENGLYSAQKEHLKNIIKYSKKVISESGVCDE